MTADSRLAPLARAGDLEALLALVYEIGGDDADTMAYRWLSAAGDLGHPEAEDLADDLLETGSLRYDDDNYETGQAHLDNAVAFFTGSDGLPRDLKLGTANVLEMRRRNYPESVQEGSALLAEARARMDQEASAAWDAALAAALSGEG